MKNLIIILFHLYLKIYIIIYLDKQKDELYKLQEINNKIYTVFLLKFIIE